MNKDEMKEQISTLFLWICEKHPEDLELKNALESSYGTWFAPDVNNEIPVILEVDDEIKHEKTYEETIKEIEDKINESFVERDISENYLPTENVKQCLQSLIINYQIIKTCTKKLLYEHGRCGEVLCKLKTFSPKNFVQLANKNGIPYKLNYINALIKLAVLLKKYPTLLKSSVSFSFVRSNFKMIEEI